MAFAMAVSGIRPSMAISLRVLLSFRYLGIPSAIRFDRTGPGLTPIDRAKHESDSFPNLQRSFRFHFIFGLPIQRSCPESGVRTPC